MLPVKPLGWGTTVSKTHDMPKKARPARESSPGPTLLAKQVPEMWGDLNVKYVAADNAAEMGCMGRYLDKGKAPDRDDPDGLPARGIKMGGCLAHLLDKLFAILAGHTEFDELMRILRSIAVNMHKSLQALDHAKACSTVSRKPWNQLDAMVKTRW